VVFEATARILSHHNPWGLCMSTSLFINVHQLVDVLTDPADEGLQGVYQVDFDARALGYPLTKRAAIALDVFHACWGFETLDDFDIVVMDAEHIVVHPDPAHEDYSGEHLGAVDKISDAPAAPRQHPAQDMVADVELCILAATEHGKHAEDPDHEVGDLQGCLREMWAMLTPAQRAAFMASDAVRERLDNALDDELVDAAYARTDFAAAELPVTPAAATAPAP